MGISGISTHMGPVKGRGEGLEGESQMVFNFLKNSSPSFHTHKSQLQPHRQWGWTRMDYALLFKVHCLSQASDES